MTKDDEIYKLRMPIVEITPPAKCDLCGKKAELRPYGPRGEYICFACGMKNRKVTERQFMHHVFGENVQ